MPANTTTAAPQGPRTAAESRREFACTAEPARRRIPQSPGQGVMYGQLALIDCISEAQPAAPDRLPAVASAKAGSPAAAFMAEVAARYFETVRILGAQKPQTVDRDPRRLWPGPYFNPCPAPPPGTLKESNR